MRSKEDETPKPIPRAPAHAGGRGVPSGWAKAPRVCLGEARNPLQWRGAVGRGRRRVARSTLQASARERTGANQARDWTGGWVSCLAEPHRASEGKRARSGFRIVLLTVVRPATHRGKWRQGVAALSTSRPLPGASIPGTSLALTTPLSSLPVPPPLGRHDTGTVSLRPTASLSPGGVVIGNDSNILELVLKPGGR